MSKRRCLLLKGEMQNQKLGSWQWVVVKMCIERCEWGMIKWPFPLPDQLLWVFFSIFVMSGCQWFACTQVRCLCVQDVFACFLQWADWQTPSKWNCAQVHGLKTKKSSWMLSYFSKIIWVLHLFRSLKINLCEEKVIWVVMTQLLWFMGVSSILVLTRKWSWVTSDMRSVILTQCCVCTIFFWVQTNTEKNQSFNGLKNHWGFTMNSSMSCSLYCMYLN